MQSSILRTLAAPVFAGQRGRNLMAVALLTPVLLAVQGCDVICWTVWSIEKDATGSSSLDCTSGHNSARMASVAVAGSSLFIPGSAHVSGASGTNWRTDLEVANAGNSQAELTLSLLERNRDNSSPVTKTFTLGPGQTVRHEDVLATVFGFSGAAALRVDVAKGLVTVTSRTYNATPSGTYGQFIDAVPESAAITEHQEGRLILLSHRRSSSSGYRTNIGFVNATGSKLRLDAALYLADGTHLGTKAYDLDPYEYRQVDKIFQSVTSSDVDDGYAVLSTTTSGGRFFAYASVVDNRTGDPVYITPVRRDAGGGNGKDDAIPLEVYYIPASAHVAGAAGTNWRTELELHNPGKGEGQYEVSLLKRDQHNRKAETKTFTVAAGHSLRLEDVLYTQFGFSGAAALRITPRKGDVIVASRTYNLTPAGTYGQFIAGVSERTALVKDERAFQIQLAHYPGGGSGFRTNIGMVNCTRYSFPVDVELFNASGNSYGTETVSLRPYEFIQADQIFEKVTGHTVTDGYAVLRSSSNRARYLAYASIIDNRTGDPVFAPAVAVPLKEPVPVALHELGEEIFHFLGFFGRGDAPTLATALTTIHEAGVETSLGAIVALFPGVATGIPQGFRLDFGDHYVLDDGTAASGTLQWTYQNFQSTEEGFDLDATLELEDFVWNGQLLDLEPLHMTLSVRTGSSNVTTDLTIRGTAGANHRMEAAGGTEITGTVHFDTSVCEKYPVSGWIRLRRDGREAYIIFDDNCWGTFTSQKMPHDGNLAFRLTWSGPQDLDIRVKDPTTGEIIWIGDVVSGSGGTLDVMSNGGCTESPAPLENVYWVSAPSGYYEFWAEFKDYCGGSTSVPYTFRVLESGVVVQEESDVISTWKGKSFFFEY